MEEHELEHMLMEGVMDGVFKLHPGKGYSMTERGWRYAERLIRTSPAAARVYCLFVLGKPGPDEPMTENRWRDLVARLWGVMSPRIHTDAELTAALRDAPPEAAAEIMAMLVDDSPEFALELAGEILALARAGDSNG